MDHAYRFVEVRNCKNGSILRVKMCNHRVFLFFYWLTYSKSASCWTPRGSFRWSLCFINFFYNLAILLDQSVHCNFHLYFIYWLIIFHPFLKFQKIVQLHFSIKLLCFKTLNGKVVFCDYSLFPFPHVAKPSWENSSLDMIGLFEIKSFLSDICILENVFQFLEEGRFSLPKILLKLFERD